MQNAGIANLGLNWRYLAFDVHPEHLRFAIAGAKAMKYVGLNLTVPHKLLALEMVDVLDDSAKTWGAVNTIRFETRNKSGEWVSLAQVSPDEVNDIRAHGFNTDADAITRSLGEDLGINLRGASVLLLGAGGAGRAAALKLASEGVANLFLLNRTEEKATQVAVEINTRFPGVRIHVTVHSPNKAAETIRALRTHNPAINIFEGYPNLPVDLVLNATSLGLKPEDALPVDANWLKTRRPRFVYDMIYRPAETPLLQLAKSIGCKTANGIGMLLYQGAKALELWSGRTAPIQTMREALEKNVYGK
ncbi:MAG: Shikimate dehydrogenase [Verrucomicrobiales bacterium]|nr:Shikimate dehydrogenase [Verrucomicrobiales bacterium]